MFVAIFKKKKVHVALKPLVIFSCGLIVVEFKSKPCAGFFFAALFCELCCNFSLSLTFSPGQFEKEGTGMSHMQLGGVDLCDNLPNPQALTAKPRNLNETNTLTHTQSLYPSQNDERGGSGLIQETSVNNRGKEGCTGRASEQDGEEDMDEVMKEDEEEEESEGSSCLIRCQSPDTPMTDSSFSETGRGLVHMMSSEQTVDKQHFSLNFGVCRKYY